MIQVVAALIWKDDRFLICQRPAHKARGLLWEFVGGKVEAGESREQALIRECEEELDISIAVSDIYMELDHVYSDITIHLTLYNAKIIDGIPKLIEHNDFKWIHPKQIGEYDFCPADEEILQKLTIEDTIRQDLKALSDTAYKEFHSKLIPTVPKEQILGVRVPKLRKYAKQIPVSDDLFLNILPHKYYEENNLQAILISNMSDYDRTIVELDRFLPFVDNWATCDMIIPKAFYARPAELLTKVREWLSSGKTYTIRFGIGVLLRYYLDDAFDADFLATVASISSREYYVNMMIAWYFATALAKQFDVTISYLTENKLSQWIHNKTIQKAIESYRIPDERKQLLRSLKKLFDGRVLHE